jgi:hypothetical protein
MLNWKRAAAILALALTGATQSIAGPVGDYVSPSVALTPNTNCGAEGVGLVVGSTDRFKGYWADETNIFDELNNPVFTTYAVNNDGYWFRCQPWIRPGQSPTTPKPDGRPCPGGTGAVVTWSVGGRSCSSYDPTKTSPSDPSRLQGSLAGELTAYHAAGSKIGTGVFRCEGGKPVLQPGSTCVERIECGGTATSNWGSNGSCSVTFQGFLPLGASKGLVSTNGMGAATAYCNPTTRQLEIIPGGCRTN